MTKSLFFNAIAKVTLGIVLVGLLIFVPAGTLAYIGGWILMGVLFIPMLIGGFVLMAKNPDLLKKRLNAKEKQGAQKGVVALSALIFLCGFVVAGLDFRFGWSHVPLWTVIAASAILLVSYALYAEVMRENAYLSRTVEVQEGQKVIDTGLYAAVRHPMYAVTLWLFLAIPVVLGSWWALVCFALYIPVIVVRIINEEKLLTRELSGYAEYKTRVKFRLVPFVW
jgi:protein-S-isoprenylcysteine O-methyltransferase Ste14